jgi:putative membrane protein
VKFLLRWSANALALYLALYLVDSLVAPRFWIKTVWIAPILAVLLGLLNSLVRPLPRLKTKPSRAMTVAALTVLANALVLQIFVWIGGPLSATNFAWMLVTAVFLSLLAGVINQLIGFKSKEKPKVITRDLRTPQEPRDREAKAPKTET